MASRTVVDSVAEVEGPPSDLERLEEQLAQLRARHRGAIFGRYLDKVPQIAPDAFVAPGATVVGDVELGPRASVWFGCVLRGDVNRIVVGARSNVQDGTVIHLGDEDPTVIEPDVVIGHRAVIHGCHIESGCLIGIQSTILDGARIGRGSIVAACALVTAATVVPPRSLVTGIPGKIRKALPDSAEDVHAALAGKYTRLSHNYRNG